jgi:hypothetical protein
VCLGEMANPVITLCKHIFCKQCITAVISRDKPTCPLCRGPVRGGPARRGSWWPRVWVQPDHHTTFLSATVAVSSAPA